MLKHYVMRRQKELKRVLRARESSKEYKEQERAQKKERGAEKALISI
jgi:hypothetical protein